MIKIAIIGDVHTAFDMADVAYFNRSDYDLILFVGDLANYRFQQGVQVARVMARLEKTAVYIPGNHDTVTPLQMLAEIRRWTWLKWLTSIWHPWRVRQLKQALGKVQMGGYQTFSFSFNGFPLDVVTGRPFSWGENLLANPHYLKKQFNVSTQADTIAKLKACVDRTQSDNLIFLAHTGPHGLGNSRSDIWGIDYKRSEGDNGDRDLSEAITYAKKLGKNVLAVAAGHMHHRLKGGGQRKSLIIHEKTHYINAALVPRIVENQGGLTHHYVKLSIADGHIEVIPTSH